MPTYRCMILLTLKEWAYYHQAIRLGQTPSTHWVYGKAQCQGNYQNKGLMVRALPK